MKFTQCLLIIAVSIASFSCRKENSEKVDQDEIWSDYRVVYNKELDKTFARGSFKHENKSGEALKLSSKSSLTIAGEKAVYDPAFTWYESISLGKDSSVTFIYEDLDGSVFTNEVFLAGIADVNPGLDSVFADSTFFLPWIGSPLTETEFVNVVLDGSLPEDLKVITQDTLGKQGVFIHEDDLSGIPLGDITIHFERWNENPAKTTAAGGISYGHYISTKESIRLVNP